MLIPSPEFKRRGESMPLKLLWYLMVASIPSPVSRGITFILDKSAACGLCPMPTINANARESVSFGKLLEVWVVDIHVAHLSLMQETGVLLRHSPTGNIHFWMLGAWL